MDLRNTKLMTTATSNVIAAFTLLENPLAVKTAPPLRLFDQW